MSRDTDDPIRQLMHEVAEVAPPPPAWDDLDGRARPDLAVAAHRRGRRSPLLAAGVVALVAAGVIALVVRGRDDRVTTIAPTARGIATTAPANAVPTTSAPARMTSIDPAPTTTVVDPRSPTPPVSAVATSAVAPPSSGLGTTTTTSIVPGDPAVELARAYLDALEAGRYAEAAALTGADGDWGDRADLAPLLPAAEPDLAGALAAWCTAGASCAAPTSLTSTPGEDGSWLVAADVGGVDVELTVTPGGPAPVAGLPPLAGAASLPLLAAAFEAEALVARLPDGQVATLDGSVSGIVDVPADATWVWADADFVWWQTSVVDEAGVPHPRTTAATFDGTVVCTVDGELHHIRPRPGGDGYVASVERFDEVMEDGGDERPVPNAAVDCEDGTEVAIDPLSWIREGGSRSILSVGERTFAADYDAEGNAEITLEDGRSLDLTDNGGYHTFSPDGSRVVYGDMAALASPHVSDHVRARDTTTGDLLWALDVDRPFGGLQLTAGRAVVSLPPAGVDEMAPWDATGAVVVVDAAGGSVVATIPTVLEIVYAG